MLENTQKTPIRYIDNKEKKVALTFDCGKGPENVDRILKILEEEKIKCSFFMVGLWADENPEYVIKISKAGHEVGDHSQTHPYLTRISEAEAKNEIVTAKGKLEKLTGKKVRFFRPPFEDYNETVFNILKENDLYMVNWSVCPGDWKDISPKEVEDKVVDKVLENGEKSSIVLLHVHRTNMVDCLQSMIKRLKSAGYSFFRVGDLVPEKSFTLSEDGGLRK